MCEKCKGAGFYVLDVPLGHPKFGQAVSCNCMDDKRKAMLLKKLEALDGLTASERLRTFVALQAHPRQLAAITALQEAVTGTYVLHGKPGTGKTHLLHCMVNHAKAQGRVAVYATMPDVLDYLRSAFNPKNEDESFEGRWKLLIECPVLCLDEMDEFSATEWARERFLRLVDERWRNRDSRLTVVALNGDPRHLLPKVASRLMQGTVLEMRSQDLRQQFKQEMMFADA